ncbi:MAG: hypothetical protein J2P51_14590, partial [Hyphomicrobiaceae bacterium]|nr:hypothetical protein [Hyphomicrobiaceae bacterium]
MAELSSPSPEVVVLIAGVVLYIFIWFATRNLSRVGKILARLAPLGLVIPAMVYLSSLSGMRPDGAPPTTRPRTSQPPQAEQERERQETAGREEASRRIVAAEEAQRRAQAEASRRAEEQGARRSGEVPPAGGQGPTPSMTEPAPARAPSEASPPAVAPPGLPSPAPPPGVAAQPEGAWDIVPVFYGTDRQRTEEPKHISYGAERARRLELGRALVTVPKTHQVPNIERPFAVRIPFTNISLYEQ